MGIFNRWNKKTEQIDFSESYVSQLIEMSDSLGQTLIDNGFGFYVDYLSKIRLAAENSNEIDFKKLVISSELFGGSGALWEIYIENQKEYLKFNRLFTEYVELLIQMGIKSGRVKQIFRTMPKLRH